jgi:predicted DNA-binding protein (MmcQ/YjbR family)
MATRSRLSGAKSVLRQFALTYPGACAEYPWGHLAIKVKGKIFLILSLEKGVLNLSLKLPLSGKDALGLPFASPTGYGLGKSGWVSSRFGAGEDVPVDMLKEWIDESYRAVAPKKLVAILEDSPEIDQPIPRQPAKGIGKRAKK